jgi:hypothetical protein
MRQGIVLYEHNTEMSAAFWSVLGDLEVLIRNAMHERLTAWSDNRHGQPAWYLDPGHVFNAKAADDIATARRHATANGRPESPGRVIAELPLEFWRFMLSSRYERSLWLPCLRDAFPGVHGRGMRRDVHDAMRELHLLRNRIAHHEPIYNRPIARFHIIALALQRGGTGRAERLATKRRRREKGSQDYPFRKIKGGTGGDGNPGGDRNPLPRGLSRRDDRVHGGERVGDGGEAAGQQQRRCG